MAIDKQYESKPKDYYAIIGVPKTASSEEIKKAFLRSSRLWHLSHNPGDSTAEGSMKDLNEAFECLSDPLKRIQYDPWHSSYFTRNSKSAKGTALAGNTSFSKEDERDNSWLDGLVVALFNGSLTSTDLLNRVPTTLHELLDDLVGGFYDTIIPFNGLPVSRETRKSTELIMRDYVAKKIDMGSDFSSNFESMKKRFGPTKKSVFVRFFYQS